MQCAISTPTPISLTQNKFFLNSLDLIKIFLMKTFISSMKMADVLKIPRKSYEQTIITRTLSLVICKLFDWQDSQQRSF